MLPIVSSQGGPLEILNQVLSILDVDLVAHGGYGHHRS